MTSTRVVFLPFAVLLIVALATHSASTWAGPNGRTLLDQCASSLTLPQLSCQTYIEGLMDGHSLSTPGGKAALYCVPPGHAGRAQKIIVKYLKKNAAELQRPAGELVFEALASAWPCD